MTLTSHDNSYFFIIQNEDLLLLKNNELPNGFNIKSMQLHFLRNFKLGHFNNCEYYCAEIANDASTQDMFYRLSLRKALSLFNDKLGLLIKAHAIITWDKHHQFCGQCKAPTTPQANFFERRCLGCNLAFFPRISPSVIVLIKKGNHLLMARSPHFLPGVYGLIAGFVEPGETAEEAIQREVMEEVGLEIKDISYFASQPWPFPDSLMLAFTANYASGEIIIDNNEIQEAGWYRYDHLPGRPSTAISIASKLIDNFVSSFK